MKFVVDHQLPPALARFLESQGHRAYHVRELGLKAADDATIWRRAAAEDLVVVSKDEDFFFFASAPNAAAKLVWVRVGNCRTHLLVERFRVRLPQIVASFEAGSNIVELRLVKRLRVCMIGKQQQSGPPHPAGTTSSFLRTSLADVKHDPVWVPDVAARER